MDIQEQENPNKDVNNNPIYVNPVSNKRRPVLLIIFIVLLALVICGTYYFTAHKTEQGKANLVNNPNPENDLTLKNNPITYFVQKKKPIYINTDDRYFPVYEIQQQIDDSDQSTLLLTVGKENEYVQQILLSSSQKLLIIQFENKITFYNLKTKKSQTLFENLQIGGVALSLDQNLLAVTVVTVKDSRNYRIAIVNLADYSEKLSLPQVISDDEPIYAALIPYFWSSADTKLYFRKILGEGSSVLYAIDLNTNELAKIDVPQGQPSQDGSKMAFRETDSPYGGCNFAEKYKIGWYNLSDSSFSLIDQTENTYYEIIMWNPEGSELLYTSQKYKPDPTCTQALETEQLITYLYNIKTKRSQKIDSIQNQLSIWYPSQSAFYKKYGAEKNLVGDDIFEKDIHYLGTIAPDVSNDVITVESPTLNQKFIGEIILRGKAKHTNEDLIYYFLYDQNLKNSSGTPLGLTSGSAQVKNFDETGYGTFEEKLGYYNNSGEAVLKLFTYESNTYEKETNIVEIPIFLRQQSQE